MSINIALPIRRFFEEHLVSQRGLSPNTVLSYRDTLKLLLQFAVQQRRKECTDLTVDDLTPQLIRQFLEDIERTRKNGAGPQRETGGHPRLLPLSCHYRSPSPRPLSVRSCGAVQTPRPSRGGISGTGRGSAYFSSHRCSETSRPKGRRSISPAVQQRGGAQEIVDLTSTISGSTAPIAYASTAKASGGTCPLWTETVEATKASSRIGV